MTVKEFIQELEGLAPEMEVKLAQQPHWPLEYRVESIVVVENEVFIVEGRQIGYLPEEASSQIGWS